MILGKVSPEEYLAMMRGRTKFAWLPVKLSSKHVCWLGRYKETWYATNISSPSYPNNGFTKRMSLDGRSSSVIVTEKHTSGDIHLESFLTKLENGEKLSPDDIKNFEDLWKRVEGKEHKRLKTSLFGLVDRVSCIFATIVGLALIFLGGIGSWVVIQYYMMK